MFIREPSFSFFSLLFVLLNDAVYFLTLLLLLMVHHVLYAIQSKKNTARRTTRKYYSVIFHRKKSLKKLLSNRSASALGTLEHASTNYYFFFFRKKKSHPSMTSTQPSQRASLNPFSCFSSYVNLLSYLATRDLGTPLAGQLMEVFARHENLSLSEIATKMREKPSNSPYSKALSSSHAEESSPEASGGKLFTDVPSDLTLDPSNTASLQSAAKSSIQSDAAVRELVTRFVIHRVVSSSGEGGSGSERGASGSGLTVYMLQPATALMLRVYYPLVLQYVRSEWGEAAERLAAVVHQLGLVSLSAAVRAVAQASSADASRSEALRVAALALLHGSVLEVAHSAANESQPRKKFRPESSSAGDLPLCFVRWNVPFLVRLLLHRAMRQLVQERLADQSGGMAMSVLDRLLRGQEELCLQGSRTVMAAVESGGRVENSIVGVEADSGSECFSPLPDYGAGPPVSFSELRSALHCDTPEEVLQLSEALERLQSPTLSSSGLQRADPTPSPFVLRCSATGASLLDSLAPDSSTYFQLHYAALRAALRCSVVERVVFARHGVMGVRLVRLLTIHHFLEDKTIAELLIAPQPRTRELLHEMMRDGLVQQREISKVDANPMSERQPKHQVYLWGLQKDHTGTMLPVVRQMVAQSLLLAFVSLGSLKKVTFPSHEEEGDEKAAAALEAYTRYCQQRVGLENVVLAHMRMLFLLDFE